MSCTHDSYVKHPGKFESSGEIGEMLHTLRMEDGATEEVFEEGMPHHALMLNTGIPCAPHAVLSEDVIGFVDYVAYISEADAETAWRDYITEYGEPAAFYHGEDWMAER